jgi:prepilin-type processing-associated H-X9-DG protein
LLAMALACFSIPFGLVISVFILVTRKRRTGVSLAVLGVFLGMLALFMILPRLTSPRIPAYRPICCSNLNGLGKAISVYAQECNDTLPSSQWCDVLIKYADVSPKAFICKSSGAKLGQSSYAFNKNLIGRKLSEINPNTVMLFETSPGWNQVGGPEILSYRSHKGEGFNILYADGHVAFEESFVDLRWEP